MLGLLADIGGTYARLQLVDLSKNPYTIVVAQTYKSCNYPNLPSLLRYFLTQSGCEKSPEMACLAVAGPVAQGRAVLTNYAGRSASHNSLMNWVASRRG